MSGLSNEELIQCSRLVHIPTQPGFSSLNLAQAVQVAAYEVWVSSAGGKVPQQLTAPLAAHEDVERLFEHLERVLVAIGFLDPAKPRRLMERLRRLFARAGLETEEVNILRGVMTAVETFRARGPRSGDPA
jgi:TrmH family RNA methyltransferase